MSEFVKHVVTLCVPLAIALPSSARAQSPTYQIGESWGPTRARNFEPRTPLVMQSIKSVVRLGSGGSFGTAFYLGKFAGKHLLATNHHVAVLPYILSSQLVFNLTNVKGRFVGNHQSWKEIDLAILEFQPSQDPESEITPLPIDFDTPPQHGRKLMVWGHGGELNPSHWLTINVEDQCRVFSQTNDIRLLMDPDTLHPLRYAAHSFAHGCDISHGDSGGPVIDLESGKVIGVNWTAKLPKDPSIQLDGAVQDLLANPSEQTWTELSYAVPMTEIKKFLLNELNDGSIRPSLRDAVKEWLTK